MEGNNLNIDSCQSIYIKDLPWKMSENPIITELTTQQQALIPIYRDKWLKIALSTERIDEERATEAIKAGYKICRLG